MPRLIHGTTPPPASGGFMRHVLAGPAGAAQQGPGQGPFPAGDGVILGLPLPPPARTVTMRSGAPEGRGIRLGGEAVPAP